MNKAVIFARVSSVGDRQDTTRQVSDLNEYATKNSMEVAKVFEEHISGAKKNGERPILIECLQYCFAEKVDILLLSELSRLGRNAFEILENVKKCKDEGLNIYFQKENVTIFNQDGTPNPFLPIIIAVLGTCAEIERENIKFRLNSGREIAKKNGVKMGRKEGSSKSKDQLLSEYPNVVKELKRGTSIRRTAKLCDCSPTTVAKVKKAMGS